MAYLRLKDYGLKIQTVQLQQVSTNDSTVRIQAQMVAQDEVISYLTQKYDVSREFTDTVVWSPSGVYKGDALVYLDADAYSNTALYAMNDLTLNGGFVYKNTTPITVGEAFNPSKWLKIGVQHTLYFVTLPNPEFEITTSYKKSTVVFWKDKNYTAAYDTTGIFPDDPIDGPTYWGNGVAYNVAAGTLPTDTTKYTEGDNRSPKIVECMVDIAVYTMHSRIPPNNIPELRVINYDNAIAWLKGCARGSVTASLPLKQPKQGRRTRFGGNVKNINTY